MITMLQTLIRAIACWLGVLEIVAMWRRWQGLSWLRVGRWQGMIGVAALLAWAGKPPAWALVAAALPAALLQVALASLRNPHLNPLLRLRPNRYDGYTITRFDLPLTGGSMPTLLIEPPGEATAAVCVLHGSGCDKTYYAWPLADVLVQQGVALLLVDLDGHGENPRVQQFPAMLENATAPVRWLKQRYQSVGLIGVSLGGCLAARAVADGLEVDGLALLEAPPALHFTKNDMVREGIGLAQPQLLYLFGESTPWHLYRAWFTTPIRAAISTWDLIAACDVLGNLPRITVPTLLLYGPRDAIVKRQQAEQVRDVAPANARFLFVPGTTHLTLPLHPRTLELLGKWAAMLPTR